MFYQSTFVLCNPSFRLGPGPRQILNLFSINLGFYKYSVVLNHYPWSIKRIPLYFFIPTLLVKFFQKVFPLLVIDLKQHALVHPAPLYARFDDAMPKVLDGSRQVQLLVFALELETQEPPKKVTF